MKAMRATGAGRALAPQEVPVPRPARGEVLVRVSACGVCRTDLHLADGELPQARYPVTPGHEIVGTVAECGPGVARLAPGMRVGVPWLGRTCGACEYCTSGRENLCDRALFTGCHLDGGYAEYAVAAEEACLDLPERYSDAEAAPLLCAGLIGYRCLTKCGDAKTLGLYGFGAAAHIIAQVANAQGRRVFAFSRPQDLEGQKFAVAMGARWAGGSDQAPPEPLEAAILFAPVGGLVPAALRAVKKGGRVVCGGIHMSEIPSFPYSTLWGERRVESVANLTRADGREFMALAAHLRIRTEVHPYPLARANEALADLRGGKFSGAAVLVP
ncbi:MAG: zinc-dependent alcohol dehydrogenase family protein [Clostridia bacterium]